MRIVKRSDLNRLTEEQAKIDESWRVWFESRIAKAKSVGCYEDLDDRARMDLEEGARDPEYRRGRHPVSYYEDLPSDLKKALQGFPAQVIAAGADVVRGWLRDCGGIVDENA